MSPTTTENNFPFIVSSGPKLQSDPSVRQLIRKQAMRDVGIARKRKGTYGKQNTGQLPRTDVPIGPVVSSSSGGGSSRTDSPETSASDTSGSSKGTEDTEVEELFDCQLVPARSTKASPNGPSFLQTLNLSSSYETTRSKFNIDIVDLSMLTNFNVGKSTIPILFADPTRLAALLGQEQWSYLSYIPSLYSQSPCVKAATDCVLAKARSVLTHQSTSTELELALYAKALRSVQAAISSPSACMLSDVLCATQLLSLHELLDPSDDSAWSHHVDGSMRVVKHRGPRRFTTEFEKALFAAHVGAIVSEALLANVACYLEEPKWMALYLGLAQESDFLTDRHPLTLNMRAIMIKLPALWHDVDALVRGPQLFDDDATAEVEYRCRSAQKELLAWTEDYKAHCVRLSLASPPEKEIAMRREIFGSSVEMLTLVKRLLSSVCDEERTKLEGEAQALAQLIFDLQKQPSPKHSWIFTGHETGVAYTVAATREQWEEDVTGLDELDRKLATSRRYNSWNIMLRTTPGA